MSEKYTRPFFYIGVILILFLAPVSQVIPINFMQSQTASATGGIVLNGTKTTSGSVVLPLFQITLSNFNVGTGSDRVLVVGVEANTASVSSITFGGVSLTKAVSSFTNNDAELWYLKNPSSTPANIVVTLSAPAQVVVGAYSFFGVSQTNPVPTTATNHNTIANSPTISITTAYSNSWVLDSTAINGGATLSSPTCTQRWNINVPNALNGGITGASSSTIKASAGSVTCSWTASRSDLWDDVAIEVKASAVSSAPTNPTSAAISTTQIKLSWTTPSDNGGSSIIGYKIQRASTSWVDVVNNTGSTLTNYNVTSLAANSVYKFHIAAWNDVGLGTYSSNVTGYTLPNTPTNLTATTISSSQINLSWTAPTGGNGTLNGYKIERSTNGGSTWSTIVANTTNTGTTYSNTGLASGTTYTYHVSALNSGGASSPSSTASATTSGTTQGKSSTGILVPMYLDPYSSTPCDNHSCFAWNSVNTTKINHPLVPLFVIANPGNDIFVNGGPGSPPHDPTAPCAFESGYSGNRTRDYENGIGNLTSQGVVVLGYVDAPPATTEANVEGNVTVWQQCYPGIKGIFLDDMPSFTTTGSQDHYKHITDYIHNTAHLAYSFGNPGNDLLKSYQGKLDLLDIYEDFVGDSDPNAAKLTNSTLQGNGVPGNPSNWHTLYDKGTYSFLQYNKASITQKTVQNASVYVGFMYFTDDTASDGNPWNSISSYLGTLASYLDNPSVLSTIQAKDTSNNLLNATITIHQSGNLVRKGITNNTYFTYNETSGWQFVLNATSLSGYTFCNWDDNSTNPVRMISPTQSLIYTANYKSGVSCP